MCFLLFFGCLIFSRKVFCEYIFRSERISTIPLISSNVSGQSEYRFNYNAAYFVLPDGESFALAVRAQNLTKDAKTPYDVEPSNIILSIQDLENPQKFSPVLEENIMIFPKFYRDLIDQSRGVEDPRITYDPVSKIYYMFYTAISYDLQMIRISKLALATCDSSIYFDKFGNFVKSSKPDFVQFFRSCWKLRGHVFTGIFDVYDKSGALLIRPFQKSNKSLLLFGSKRISIAETSNLLSYRKTGDDLIKIRSKEYVDSYLVESGPNPLELSDGNYLFLYNSARLFDDPNPKNYNRQYNLGYVIFNLTNSGKLNIVQRMNQDRLLFPLLDWEKCDESTKGSYYYTGLTPNVVFACGWKKNYELSENGIIDVFDVIYQGCDSFTSIVRISVSKG